MARSQHHPRRAPRIAAAFALAAATLAGAGVVEVAQPGASAQAATVLTPATPIATQKQQILDGINAKRASLGLAPVAHNTKIDAVSQGWADTLGANGTTNHNPNFHAEVQTVSGCQSSGEILTMAGGSDPNNVGDGNQAVRAWVGSPSHYAILTKAAATEIGIGIAYVKGYDALIGAESYRTYWVANFAACGSTPAPVTPPYVPPFTPVPPVVTTPPVTAPASVIVERRMRTVR